MIQGLSSSETTKLVAAATDSLRKAYAPYSNFKVGAAVITEAGNIFSGCNIENVSYSLTICAERVAIFSAVSSEGADNCRIRGLAVVSKNKVYCPPCGACRQVISEFGPEAAVIYPDDKGLTEVTLADLFPKPFRLE